jgi:hypothetical protein
MTRCRWPRSFGKWLRMVTTARDNESPSLLRTLGLAGGVLFIALGTEFAILAAMRPAFDAGAFGGAVASIMQGLAVMIAAVAAALRISLPANAGNDGWQAPPLPPTELTP